MLNSAFMEFFNGRLSLAPIEESDPRNILDIGCANFLSYLYLGFSLSVLPLPRCGSGAWCVKSTPQVH